MSKLSCLFVCVLSVLTVKAFPSAREAQLEKAYVLYRMPSRCVDAPRNDICDLGYKIRNMGNQEFDSIVSTSFGGIGGVYKTLGFSDECIEKVMKLTCRSAFPECLPNGQIDYGNQHEIIEEINLECGDIQLFNKANYETGIHDDPYPSSYTFKCIDVPQDPDQKCPKPKHPMFEGQAKDYYERIQNLSKDTTKEKYPQECLDKAFNVFACSYPFCSSDGHALLMETTEDDCRDIGECLEKYGKYDEESMEFLNDVCPKYPSADRNEVVYPPY